MGTCDNHWEKGRADGLNGALHVSSSALIVSEKGTVRVYVFHSYIAGDRSNVLPHLITQARTQMPLQHVHRQALSITSARRPGRIALVLGRPLGLSEARIKTQGLGGSGRLGDSLPIRVGSSNLHRETSTAVRCSLTASPQCLSRPGGAVDRSNVHALLIWVTGAKIWCCTPKRPLPVRSGLCFVHLVPSPPGQRLTAHCTHYSVL